MQQWQPCSSAVQNQNKTTSRSSFGQVGQPVILFFIWLQHAHCSIRRLCNTGNSYNNQYRLIVQVLIIHWKMSCPSSIVTSIHGHQILEVHEVPMGNIFYCCNNFVYNCKILVFNKFRSNHPAISTWSESCESWQLDWHFKSLSLSLSSFIKLETFCNTQINIYFYFLGT